jgi:hypothetical protein
MAKRFTDTDKWKKPFLRGMKAPYKLLWIYILDECDHAGIWQVDIEVAEIKIGEKLKIEEALKFFYGRIIVLEEGLKWFIIDFVEFQYSTLNPENRVHNSIISILNKYSILDENFKIKPLTSPLEGAKDKDKDKDMDMVKDKDMIISQKSENKKIGLIFPYDSFEFMSAWNILASSKKWKSKPQTALQASLKKLSKECEQDAITMINNCIAGNWMGLVDLKPHEKISNKPGNIISNALNAHQSAMQLIDEKYGESANNNG